MVCSDLPPSTAPAPVGGGSDHQGLGPHTVPGPAPAKRGEPVEPRPSAVSSSSSSICVHPSASADKSSPSSSSVPLDQLAQFLSFLEYLGSHPEQIYRPSRLAAALGLSPSRVRRWLILLTNRRWLVQHGKNYVQSGLFKTWGDAYAARILIR